jgi:hypothetical protein
LKKMVAESVDIYNAERPHLSCGMLSPTDVHERVINPSRATPSWG